MRRSEEKQMGFPKALRLRKRREYRRVYDEGDRAYGRFFAVFFKESADPIVVAAGRPRLGVTVTRKVGNACVRNRLRRLVREVFRRHRHPIPANRDIVVNPRPGAVGQTTEVLQRDLEAVFHKIRMAMRKGAPS